MLYPLSNINLKMTIFYNFASLLVEVWENSMQERCFVPTNDQKIIRAAMLWHGDHLKPQQHVNSATSYRKLHHLLH